MGKRIMDAMVRVADGLLRSSERAAMPAHLGTCLFLLKVAVAERGKAGMSCEVWILTIYMQ